MNMLRSSRGYSMMEMLVVVAIIGVLSLVTIPAFINFQRRNAVRSALRSFTSDMRSYRQQAITKNAWVRVQFTSGREYRGFISRDQGKTWQPLSLKNSTNNVETLPEEVFLTDNTYDDSDLPLDGLKDVDFHYDGLAGDFKADGTIGTGSITVKTNFDTIIDQFVVQMSSTGQIKTTESTTK